MLLAADSVGAGDAMIARAVGYAGEREQFGRVISNFQAIKQMCAEMLARLQPCRSLVWYAAHAFDAVLLMACHAKSQTGEVGRFVARKGSGEAARNAAQLTIYQPTPIRALPMRQRRLTTAEQAQAKPGYPKIFRQRRLSSGGFEIPRRSVGARGFERGAHATFERLRANVPGKPRQLLNYPSVVGYAKICDTVAGRVIAV